MEFGLNQVQRMYRDQLRTYVEDNVIGENATWDDDEGFPEDVWADLCELGVVGLSIPEEHGGEGLDPITAGVVYEELGRGDVGFATLVLAENLVNHLLAAYGRERHREIAMANANGDVHLAFALTEPDHGSDAQAIETTAERDGDGWILTGEKTAITGATTAGHVLTYACETDSDGIRAFLVPTAADGVECKPYPALGCEVSGWGQVHLDGVRVDGDALVSEDNGFRMAMQTFDKSRAWIGLYCLGAARQTLEETQQYLVDREAFGKPLAGYEGPQFQMAELETHLDAARLKAYEALWRAREGKPHTKDAAMVKWYAPQIATRTIHECLVLHGHYGYSKDFGIEKRLRDTIGLEIGDGTPHVQKLIVARETFGTEYLPY
ncbi:MAG: acyl-CoA dehydrogenase family protein [Natronomonas sp.]|nr:acyl-CoA dehydrogenase family protein [Natronomonas sp.]